MINLKNFKCDCGIYSTPPDNSIKHEHVEFCLQNGYEYREAIQKQDGNTIILLCPGCGKQLYKVTY